MSSVKKPQSLHEIVVSSHAFQWITARIHQRNRRKQLRSMAGDLIEKYKVRNTEQEDAEVSNYIWVCWWQGEENMSPIVKECYRRICTYNSEKKVVLITEENLEQWVTFPEYIMEKYNSGTITKTHFSDLLRVELLKEYGGVWMDITLMTFSGVPERFYHYPVYTGKYPSNPQDYNVSKNRWTSYFWVSRYPRNILFCFMSDFWRVYWGKQDVIIEYFLIDYVLDFAYRYVKSIRKELDAVPMNGCGIDAWKLLKILSEVYQENVITSIQKENWMQKLSYKGEDKIQSKSSNPELSTYNRLFLQ